MTYLLKKFFFFLKIFVLVMPEDFVDLLKSFKSIFFMS